MPGAIKLEEAVLVERCSGRPGAEEWIVRVEPGGEEELAVAYPELVGPLREGDRVLLNTTTVALRLGTGGAHFVVARLGEREREAFAPEGHLIKLRYTPLQHAVRVVEEGERPSDALGARGSRLAAKPRSGGEPRGPSVCGAVPVRSREPRATSRERERSELPQSECLHGMPVIAAELHSQMAAAAIAARAFGGAGLRIVYVMSDTAALPMGWSRLVARLREEGVLTATITAGQAFGGDLEAINVHSALLAARHVVGADLAIVAQGPGNAGTGTPFGFGGLAQGEHLNAAAALGGEPIAALRVSFVDPRPRHRGVSHHSLTVLGRIALGRCRIPVPRLADDEAAMIDSQLAAENIPARHDVERIDLDPAAILASFAAYRADLTTMGRGVGEDLVFFLAAAAAGVSSTRKIAR